MRLTIDLLTPPRAAQSDKKSLKGHFDLRNVEKLKLVATEDDKAAGGADAVILSISEEGKAPKQMTISFKEDKGARVGWLKLWASAVAAAGVDKQLQQHIDPALSALLNEKYATQEAVSRQRSIFGSQVAYTKVLTPRQSSNAIAQAQAGAGAASSGLDTPRPGELPPPASLPPPTSLPGVPENEAPTTFEITVPEGVKPGDRLQATTPQGTKVKLVVPEGAEPGMLLTFQVPKDAKKKKALAKEDSIKQEKSAIAIQKRLRGMRTRKVVKPPSVAKPQMKISDEDVADLSKARPSPRFSTLPRPSPALFDLRATLRSKASLGAAPDSARDGHLSIAIQCHLSIAIRLPPFDSVGTLRLPFGWHRGPRLPPDGPSFAACSSVPQAAVKLQSNFRGLATRNAQQESARLQWLEYYIETEDWEQAGGLAVTPEEEASIEKAKLAAAANEGVSEDEERRQKWLKYYLNQAEFAKAEELVASPFESAMLLKAKALRSNACCSCLPKGALEMERVARFVASVRAYEWDMAEVLAMTSEEMQDVADSKLRVAHFQQAMSEGKYDEAKGLAITDGEEAQIVSAMRAAGGNGFAKVDSHHLVSSMSVSDVPVTAETEKAALKVQAIVRGHQVRARELAEIPPEILPETSRGRLVDASDVFGDRPRSSSASRQADCFRLLMIASDCPPDGRCATTRRRRGGWSGCATTRPSGSSTRR